MAESHLQPCSRAPSRELMATTLGLMPQARIRWESEVAALQWPARSHAHMAALHVTTSHSKRAPCMPCKRHSDRLHCRPLSHALIRALHVIASSAKASAVRAAAARPRAPAHWPAFSLRLIAALHVTSWGTRPRSRICPSSSSPAVSCRPRSQQVSRALQVTVLSSTRSPGAPAARDRAWRQRSPQPETAAFRATVLGPTAVPRRRPRRSTPRPHCRPLAQAAMAAPKVTTSGSARALAPSASRSAASHHADLSPRDLMATVKSLASATRPRRRSVSSTEMASSSVVWGLRSRE
mmetsp:Transcript_8196/g.24110  ORF Transcript_8196/g.24110 Transcript_8196/m.24110 type:complete len:294 (-) Transcript_8196:176-1057(-)